MSAIPPPMEWPPQDDHLIMLPFELADMPRQFLNFLATDSYLKLSQREAIGEWMTGYNEVMAEWIEETYGGPAVDIANEIAKESYREFLEGIKGHSKALTDDVFKHLEDEMLDGST